MIPLSAAATELLGLVESVAAAEGVTLPERRYVAPGGPTAIAWDCDQVTVSLATLQSQVAALFGADQVLPAPSLERGAPSVPTGIFAVTIVRYVPTLDDNGDPPPADQIALAGAQALDDAALLRLVAAKAATNGALTHAAEILIGNVTPLGPEGGTAAMQLALGITVV